MSSLADCVRRAVDGGLMNKARGEALWRKVRDLEAMHAHLGPDAAAAKAAVDAKAWLRTQTQRQKRLQLKQIATARRLWRQIEDYRNLWGEANAADAIPALLEWDQAAEFDNVSSVRDALRGRYHRMIGDFLGRHARDVLGRVRQRADLPNIVRELRGERTGDAAAAKLAEAVGRALEQARRDFNAAGGDIGRLEDWGLPQSHDAGLMRAAGSTPGQAFRAWAEVIEPLLDWQRIRDFETDLPFSAGAGARKTAFLRRIYDDIVSDGWARAKPTFRAGGAALASRRADHRVLHFVDADAWLAYNERFGQSGIFETLVVHLDHMARDTALMRVLGPNPAAGLEFARQAALKLAATRPWKPGPVDRLRSSNLPDLVARRSALAQNMLAQLTGAANIPQGDLTARWLAGFRHLQTSAMLGSAMLSAVSDVGFQEMAARHIGLDPTRVLRRHMAMLVSSADRQQALRTGVIADELANVGSAQARFMGEAFGPEVAQRLSEATMRLSGLTRWTEAGRHAFQLEVMGLLADHVGHRWADLPDPVRRHLLEARGIRSADWDVIRSTALHKDGGASFLVPDDIRHRTDLDPRQADELATRLMAAIREQVEFAVPSNSLRGRAMVLQGAAPGTLLGELSRSALMFKNFALTVYFLWLRRIALAPVNGSRLGQAAKFAAMTTAMGAVSLQMKEISKGRDPRDMTTGDFARAAFLQGGGVGIWGDFVYSAENRFGGGLISTMAGPQTSAIADALTFGVGTVQALREGKATNAGRKIVRGIQANTPLSSLWYANLAMQRSVWDQLQWAADPEAAEAFRRYERRRSADYGNPSWWLPGTKAPQRPPDLSRAIGAAP